MKKTIRCIGLLVVLIFVFNSSVFAKDTTTENRRIKWGLDNRSVFEIGSKNILRFSTENAEIAEIFALQDNEWQILDYCSASDTAVVLNHDTELIFIQTETQTENRFDSNIPFLNALCSPDGYLIAAVRADEIGVILFTPQGEEYMTLSGYDTAAPVYSVKFSEDGQGLLWFARAGVQTQNIETGVFGAEINFTDFISQVVVDLQHGMIVSALWDTESGKDTLWTHNSLDGALIGKIEFGENEKITDLEWVNGTLMIALSTQKDLYVIDIQAQKILWKETCVHATNTDEEMLQALSVSPDAQKIVLRTSAGTLIVVDLFSE